MNERTKIALIIWVMGKGIIIGLVGGYALGKRGDFTVLLAMLVSLFVLTWAAFFAGGLHRRASEGGSP